MKLHPKAIILISLLVIFPVPTHALWKAIGPSAGSIQVLLTDPTKPQYLYVLNNDHLYHSSDGGRSWQRSPTGFVPRSDVWRDVGNTLAIAVHPRTGQVMVIDRLPYAQRVLVSDDHGVSFQARPFLTFPLRQILYHPVNPQIVFGFGFYGVDLCVSADGARSWKYVSNLPCPGGCSSLDSFGMRDAMFLPWEPDTLFVSGTVYYQRTQTAVWVLWLSRNAGRTWRIMDVGHPYEFHVDYRDPDRAFLRSGGLWLVTPKTFRNVKPHSDWISILANVPGIPGALIASDGTRLFVSGNSGHTWEPEGKSIERGINTLQLTGGGRGAELLIGTPGDGLFRTRFDSTNLEPSNNGFHEGFSYQLAAVGSSPVLYLLMADPFGGFARYCARYSSSKGEWSDLTPNLPVGSVGWIAADPHNSSRVGIADEQNIWISFDSGRNWRKAHFPHPTFRITHPHIAFSPSHSGDIYAWADRSIFKSTDGGQNFIKLPLQIESEISTVRLDKNVNGLLYYTLETGQLFKSTDGITATEIDSGILGADDRVEELTPLSAALSYLAIVSHPQGKTIYKTVDAGNSWQFLGKFPLDITTQNLLSADPLGMHIYLLGNGSLYETTDGAHSWEKMKPVPGDLTILDVDLIGPSVLYAASQHGVYLFDPRK